MSIFIKATQSGWYQEFLNPVVDSILASPEHKKVLDIGTGPGTLPQILISKDSSLLINGIDLSRSMIDLARRSISHPNISFEYLAANMPLPYAKSQFDVLTFCSVLFLLDDSNKRQLMNEALRILNPRGKIIILTPSGKKSILSSFFEVWRFRFSYYNFTFPIWKVATSSKARIWQKQKWLEKYTRENKLNYKKSLTFNNNATIEIISKSIKI